MNIFNWFKKKRLRTLEDIDSLSLKEADKLGFANPMLPNIDKILQIQSGEICPKCSGQANIVREIIKMDGMYLRECEVCHERFYK